MTSPPSTTPPNAAARLVGNLSREERARLFEELRRRKAAAPSASPALSQEPREGRELPLSFAQQRLWFLDRLAPGSPLYNIPSALRMTGPLNPAVLAACFSEIVRRHEAVRTRFDIRGDQPVQIVEPARPLDLPVVDLAGLPDALPALRAAEERRLIAEEAAAPFDLGRSPLLRARLIRMGEAHHTLLVTLHHIAGDAWSAGIVVRELAALFEAFAAGRPSPLPELAMQYADYAHAQRAAVGAVAAVADSGALSREIAYWRARLAGAQALDLPTDRPRPPVPSFAAGFFNVRVPAGMEEALRRLARAERATLLMALLAPFSALLSRLAGSEDVAAGTTVAGRNRQVEELIGFFINMLVLRTGLSGDPDGRELLLRSRDTVVGAFDHQEIPFDKLVDEIGLPRDPYRPPLLRAVLQLHLPEPRAELPGLSVIPVPLAHANAKFDLLLNVFDQPQGLLLQWMYDADLFDTATVARFSSALLTLTGAWLEEPGLRLSELPILRPEERHQLLAEWDAGSAAGAERGRSVLHRLFEAQAEAAPEAPALSWEGESLTYRELDRRANRLARHLAATGVRQGDIVGLCLEPSFDQVVALLAVLKAGAAYLPLDPSSPAERLAFTLADSGAALVVATSGTAEALGQPERTAVPRVLLDAEESFIAARSDGPLALESDPEETAYVIYTSGSTGRPKGVMVPHGNVTRLLSATAPWFGFGPEDVWTLFHSYAFDFSVWEIWGALLGGGRLVLVPYRVSRSPADFYRLLRDERVTVLNQTPSAFRQLLWAEEAVRNAEAGLDLSLRCVIFGGEALDPASLRPWIERHGDEHPRLVNMYGITETTVHVTYRPIRREDMAGGGSPIGRSMPDLSVRVLDPLLRLQPVGVAGEICVGGEGLASGYLRRPDLTAERFVPDPYGPPGARLYRSGDLARRLPDGGLDYLGRRDQQVKIRGYRIELGEIEAAVARHPGVREAVVVARADENQNDRLFAYVTAAEEAPTLRELRVFLVSVLPEPMIPSALVVLDRLPLTVNGKVDRRALPSPKAAAPIVSESVPPRDELERLLADLFRDVLRIPAERSLGIEDDFFELGGSSITGAILINRVQQALGVGLPVAAVFTARTVAALAGQVRTARPEAAQDGIRGILRLGQTAAPLSFSQERLWFLDRLQPGSATYNMPGPLRLRGPVDPAVLAACFDEIRRRHEALRTRFETRGGAPVQVIDPPDRRPLPCADLSALPEPLREREAAQWTSAEAAWPFDLERGPLLRAVLLRLSPREHALLLTLHHIVSDGWSVRVLLRELTVLYAAFAEGRPSPLPELPVQYADFAVWQRERLAGPELGRQVAYWRERLGGDHGELPTLDLPLDHPRPALQTFRGAAARGLLPRRLADGLRRLGLAQRASLFMVLIAGFSALLRRFSGQDDVLLGTPVAGRVRPEVEELIGFFLNTLVLRTDLSNNPSFAELVARVREAAVGAYGHQDVPFEKLLAELQPERDLSRTPLFQVFFNLLNFAPEEIRLPGGVTVEPLAGLAVESKFDLTVYAAEGEEGIGFNLVYNADLFDAPRMEELLRQYRLLLEGAVADPRAAVDALSLVTPEAAALLPDPTAPLGAEWREAVHEMFLEWARRHPERTAVADRDGVWTYGELAGAVERLAGRLQAGGVGRGGRVAVWAHRSAPVAWAVLGALRSGAAFVMLDPTYPPARLLEMLRLARPGAWVEIAAAGPPPPEVEEHLRERAAAGELLCRLVLPGGGPAGAADLLAAWSRPEASPDHLPEIGPDDAATVSFTSGSTGVPKGILGRHGPLSHFLPWQTARFGLTADDRYSLLSGLAHDPLQRDLFTSLCTGATLCVPPADEILTPGRLAVWAARERVTVAHLTPAMAQLLTETTSGASLPDLRYVLLVGDVLTRLDVDRIRRLAPRATCVNLYGSTETQRAVAFHVAEEAGAAGERAKQILPLGRGMEDVQLLVINPAGRLAGIGELGEIHVRSPHLALGYLEDEALTAGRFLVNPFIGPFTGEPGDRVYRTGDLGRYLPDGEAAFAGRADQQVKIRGFRIELGEIEAALGRLPGVREAIVLARDSAPGDRRLVAYLTPEIPDTAALRDALRAQLPAYMVPAAFVPLPRLPVTPNGKVDRKALAKIAPEAQDANLAAAFVEPRSDVERRIAALWREVLGVEQVGVRHNFFDLGGHSLLLVRLHARIQEELACELPLVDLFNHPNIEALARHLERQTAEAPAPAREEGARDRAQRQIEAARRQKELARARRERSLDEQ